MRQTVDLKDQFAFSRISSLGEGFAHLVDPGFAVAAMAVIFYFLLGAFKFLRSGGDKEAVASARAMITHAIIGFILLMLMFLIVKYIPELLGLTGYQIIK